MIDKTFIAGAKKKLEAELEKLEPEIKKLTTPVDMGDDVDDFDEETDEAEEFSANVGMAQSLKERYERIKDALAKIEAGTYGSCEQCKKPIESGILTVDPESQYCKACKATKK